MSYGNAEPSILGLVEKVTSLERELAEAKKRIEELERQLAMAERALEIAAKDGPAACLIDGCSCVQGKCEAWKIQAARELTAQPKGE